MRQDLQVSASIELNVSPETVWKALITPEIIKEYLFGTETVTDWKVGSDIIFQGEYEGHKYKDKGVIKEFVPLKKISYSYWSGFSGVEDKPENYSLVTYDVESKDSNTTQFTWTQIGFATEQGYEHSKTGMDEFLKKIKEVVEAIK